MFYGALIPWPNKIHKRSTSWTQGIKILIKVVRPLSLAPFLLKIVKVLEFVSRIGKFQMWSQSKQSLLDPPFDWGGVKFKSVLTTPVSITQKGEPPNIPKAHGKSDAGQQEVDLSGPLLPLVDFGLKAFWPTGGSGGSIIWQCFRFRFPNTIWQRFHFFWILFWFSHLWKLKCKWISHKLSMYN